MSGLVKVDTHMKFEVWATSSLSKTEQYPRANSKTFMARQLDTINSLLELLSNDNLTK